ncbi:hypothetical protein ACLBYG_22570 [Methylobacterium sp. D53M]
MMPTVLSRLFWRAYWPVTAFYGLTLLCVAAGPHVHGHLFPVHVDMAVRDVVRTHDSLCWDYTSTKVKEAATDDLDVFLYVEGRGRLVVSPYGYVDGLPWQTAAAPKMGPYRKRWCVDLAERLPDTVSVRFELTAYYAGPFGLWRVPLHWPPVTAPGLP